ncbi:MAG: hypothetical protein K0U98_04800 [Deltaproteobacteria bacterium]|nr:hypothetical protein [Deltaproteobacteria bacterium]
MFRRTILIAMVVTGVVATIVPRVGAQTVEEVIERNVEARGGPEAWKAIETIRMTGTMSLGDAVSGPLAVEFKRPDRMRIEFSVEGAPAIQAYDGETAWAVVPFAGAGPRKLAPEQMAEIVEQADFEGPLIGYQAKGHEVELLGRAKVDGKEVFEILVKRKGGASVVLSLDASSYLEIRQTVSEVVQGNEVEVIVDVSDYREVAGVLFPFQISQTISVAPAPQIIRLSKVEVGVEISDDRFSFPQPSASVDQ